MAKRFFRLALPCAAASVFAYALAGYDCHQAAAAATGSLWLERLDAKRPQLAGLARQVVWGTWFGANTLNNAMWTMELELAGSFLVFVLLAVLQGSGDSARSRWRVLPAALIFLLGSSPTTSQSLQATVHWGAPFAANVPLGTALDSLGPGGAWWPHAAPEAPATLPAALRHGRLRRHQPPPPPPGGAGRPPAITDPLGPGPDVDALASLRALRETPAEGMILSRVRSWAQPAPHVWYAPFVTGMMLACVHRADERQVASTKRCGWSCGRRALWHASVWGAAAAAGACAYFPFGASALANDSWLLCQGMRHLSRDWLQMGGKDDVLWYTAGATCLVHAALGLRPCGRALACAPARWLGRISFGLYLTHIPVLYTLTCELFIRFFALAAGHYASAAFAACAVSIVAMLLLAEAFTQLVDKPSLRLSAAMGRWLLAAD